MLYNEDLGDPIMDEARYLVIGLHIPVDNDESARAWLAAITSKLEPYPQIVITASVTLHNLLPETPQ